jgi:hypothetical protein
MTTDYTFDKYTVTFDVQIKGRVQTWQFGLSEYDMRRMVAGEDQMVLLKFKGSEPCAIDCVV